MGDRAVISNKNKRLGVYLHWYGYREFVESILAYCDAKKYRSPDIDDEYGWARLCQVAGNTIGGSLSVGVGIYDRMDIDNWDNGTYIIEGWNIKERLYQQYVDEKIGGTMYENLKYINERQPKEEQLEDNELNTFAKYWEVKHLDRLNDKRKEIVEKQIKEEQEQQAKENTDITEKEKSPDEICEKDKAKLNKVVTELSTDVQKPTENNFKEDNAVNDIEKKGDEEFAR